MADDDPPCKRCGKKMMWDKYESSYRCKKRCGYRRHTITLSLDYIPIQKKRSS